MPDLRKTSEVTIGDIFEEMVKGTLKMLLWLAKPVFRLYFRFIKVISPKFTGSKADSGIPPTVSASLQNKAEKSGHTSSSGFSEQKINNDKKDTILTGTQEEKEAQLLLMIRESELTKKMQEALDTLEAGNARACLH